MAASWFKPGAAAWCMVSDMNTATMDATTSTDNPPEDGREGGLLAWQFRNYAAAHHDRRNLLVHATTVPLFWAGSVALALAVPVGSHVLAAAVGIAVAGMLAMAAAVSLQGQGHARETGRPAPFRGPVDVVARIFAEQWITFPRFVATGGFARAWARGARKV